jgi:hypothetical protein
MPGVTRAHESLEIGPGEQVDQVLSLVREILGTDVVGAYLHGSAVLGALRPRGATSTSSSSRRGARPATRPDLAEIVEFINRS